LLVAAPLVTTTTDSGALERVFAVLSAAEAHGEQLVAEWLRPPSWANLTERLAAEPAIDVLCVVATLTGDALVWPDGSLPLADLLASASAHVRLVILVADGQDALPSAADPSVLLSGLATPAQVQDALTALLSELLAGEPLGVAIAGMEQAMTPAKGLSRAAAGAGGVLPFWHGGLGEEGVARVVPFPEAGLLPAWRRLPQQPTPGGLPEAPSVTLVGRLAERSALEEALTTSDRRIICLHGPVGRGKTALVTEMARWLVRTGASDHVVYSSLAGGLLPDALLFDLGYQLVGPSFSVSDADASERVTAALSTGQTLVIWDNVEAAYSPDSLGYTDEARARLLGLARELAHLPGCRLALIADGTSCPSALAALDPLSIAIPALGEAESLALLRSYAPVGQALNEADVMRAATLLGGNPLCLRCAAAGLAAAAGREVSADQEWPLANTAHLDEEAVGPAIELLLRGLSPDDRLAVNALGLYLGGFFEPMTLRTIGLDAANWAPLKATLAAAGLIAEEHVDGINIAWVAMHPALTAYLLRQVTPRQKQVLATPMAQDAYGLMTWLPRGEERVPGLARRLLRLELANVAAAVDLAIAREDLNLTAELVQIAAPLLSSAGLRETAGAIAQRLDRATAAAIPSEGPLGRPAVQFMLRQGEMLLRSGQAEQAAALLGGLVQRITGENGQSYSGAEALYDQGLALRLFGSVMRSAARPEIPVTSLRRAISLFGQARSLPEARGDEAQAWRELAELYVQARQADAAEDAAQHGLELAEHLEDQALIGLLRAQLGAVAGLRGDADVALEHLQRAAESLNAAQAWSELANTWARIATVYEKGKQDLPAAAEAYGRAIAVATANNLQIVRGQMLMQRARLQSNLGQPQMARGDLELAVEVYRSAGQPGSELAALCTLSELALGQGELSEAERQAQQARELGETSGIVPWEVYHLLQRIAQHRGDADAEAAWRQRTQQAFASSPAAPAVIQQWFGLIRAVAEACRGSALSGEAAQLIDDLEANASSRPLADALWSLLEGARGQQVYSHLDHVGALIIRTILRGIDHPEMFERPPASAAAVTATQDGAPRGANRG